MADIVGNETLRDLWEVLVADRGDHQFLSFHNRIGRVFEYTYEEFDYEINRAANAFITLGIEKGERVAVQLHTSPEFLMCLFGLAKIGAVMVPINEQYLADEAAFVLGSTDAVCAVVEPQFYDVHGELLRKGLVFPKGLLVARAGDDSPQSDADFADACRALGRVHGYHNDAVSETDAFENACPVYSFWDLVCAEAGVLREKRPLASDDVAELIYTSGTTSRPKGVVITHANMIFAGLYGDWEVSMRSSDRMLSTMPACHSNFQLAGLMPVLTAGATLIVVEKYSARRFWKQAREYKATVVQSVAMMLRTMMLQPVDPEERNHSVREVLFFMTVTDEEKEGFEKRFGTRIMNTYGSTESITWVLTDPPVGRRRWPSVGRVGLGYEARIADDNNNELGPGEIGEIQVRGVRGRTLMLEYFNDPEATAASFTSDGWFKSGDKGYRDEDGWFFFVDRKSNMIKRAGENISTTELETILMEHPLIEEAAVIGIEDDIRDVAVKAFVLLEQGASMTTEEVIDYCTAHMASFKVPSYVEFVTSFPRTCSMKVEKKLLS